MEIDEALTTHLLAHAGLTALIAGRFFHDEMPQGTALPAVVCINVSDVKDHTHQGQVTLESPVYQFTAYAETKGAAKAVAAQIKAALSDYTGTMSGLAVKYIKLLNELSTLDASADGLVKVYTTDLEYEINYETE